MIWTTSQTLVSLDYFNLDRCYKKLSDCNNEPVPDPFVLHDAEYTDDVSMWPEILNGNILEYLVQAACFRSDGLQQHQSCFVKAACTWGSTQEAFVWKKYESTLKSEHKQMNIQFSGLIINPLHLCVGSSPYGIHNMLVMRMFLLKSNAHLCTVTNN